MNQTRCIVPIPILTNSAKFKADADTGIGIGASLSQLTDTAKFKADADTGIGNGASLSYTGGLNHAGCIWIRNGYGYFDIITSMPALGLSDYVSSHDKVPLSWHPVSVRLC